MIFKTLLKSIIIFFCLIIPTYAYLGPGIAGGVLAATLGIVIALLAMIFGLIWFPLKKALDKKKKKKNKID